MSSTYNSHQSSEESTHSESTKRNSRYLVTPFSHGFFDKSSTVSQARATYFKVAGVGIFAVIVTIFAIFSIYWGALWQTTAHIHNLKGWVVDFDNSLIGHTVTQTLSSISGTPGFITWEIRSASEFPGGPADVSTAVYDQNCWAAIAIHANATNTLLGATGNADSSFNASLAITGYGVEGRNENAYRLFLHPNIDMALGMIGRKFAQQYAAQIANRSNIVTILTNAPQIVTQPISYTMTNIRPFDIPVATAASFVGLIPLTILCYFTVMILYGAREASGVEKHLSYLSIAALRVISPLLVYLILSLLFSLLNLAFQVPYGRFFGHGGFVIYWMLCWFGMSALGLSLDAMLTLLTPRFIPFFLILWILSNVSVALYPMELLPGIFKYGYAAPFFNVSQGTRSILFGTKNHLRLNFGVLVAWVAISCITLSLFVLIRHRSAKKAHATMVTENGKIAGNA